MYVAYQFENLEGPSTSSIQWVGHSLTHSLTGAFQQNNANFHYGILKLTTFGLGLVFPFIFFVFFSFFKILFFF